MFSQVYSLSPWEKNMQKSQPFHTKIILDGNIKGRGIIFLLKQLATLYLPLPDQFHRKYYLYLSQNGTFSIFFWPMWSRQSQSHRELFLLRGKKNGIHQIIVLENTVLSPHSSFCNAKTTHPPPVCFQIYSQLNKHRGKQGDTGHHKASRFAPLWASQWCGWAAERIPGDSSGHQRAAWWARVCLPDAVKVFHHKNRRKGETPLPHCG